MSLSSFNRFTFLLASICLLLLNGMNMFMYNDFTMLLEINIFSTSSIEFSLMMIIDKISLSFGFVVTLISSCVFAFASSYMKEDVFYNRFILILLSFVISMNLLIYSGSIFMILLGWDGLGITSFALIIYYQNKESLSAGFLTMIINRIGDVLIVSSMCLMFMFGQLNIYPMNSTMWMLSVLLCVASLTKSAQYPFSPWLPAAMAAPTPVSALVHSSTLVTAGVYLVIRLSFNIPLSSESMMMLCFCGSITCLLGGIAAIVEMDLKKIIALSTLSQLGVMMFSLGLNFPLMGLFHLYTHAMFKALLFLVAGMVLMMVFGTQDLRLLGGVLLMSPILTVLQNISSLCLVGAPFLSAFYSKHAILELMMMSHLNLMSIIIMMIATMCTVVYVFRSLKVLCWGKLVTPMVSISFKWYSYLPLIVLGLMGVIGGKVFWGMNSSTVMIFFLPSVLGNLINLISIVGMFLGLLMSMKMNYYFLSSLFFLTSSWNMMTKSYSLISSNMKNLDYGWLEPMVSIYPYMYKVANYFNNMFLWPSVNFYSLIRGFTIMILVYGFIFIIYF